MLSGWSTVAADPLPILIYLYSYSSWICYILYLSCIRIMYLFYFLSSLLFNKYNMWDYLGWNSVKRWWIKTKQIGTIKTWIMKQKNYFKWKSIQIVGLSKSPKKFSQTEDDDDNCNLHGYSCLVTRVYRRGWKYYYGMEDFKCTW